jgi:hypothetical protein
MQISAWVATLQNVVNAIRTNGGANTILLLPGLSYSNAGALPSEAGPQLLSIKNPDGTVNNLVSRMPENSTSTAVLIIDRFSMYTHIWTPMAAEPLPLVRRTIRACTTTSLRGSGKMVGRPLSLRLVPATLPLVSPSSAKNSRQSSKLQLLSLQLELQLTFPAPTRTS